MPRSSAPGNLLALNPETQRRFKEWEERNRRILEGGRWLREYHYTHKLDVSFPSTMRFSAVREAVYVGFRCLGNHLRRGVRWVAVVAVGRVGGLHHVHALVYAPPPGLSVHEVRCPWRNALTHARLYKLDGGAEEYAVEHIIDDAGDIFWSKRHLPRRRDVSTLVPGSARHTLTGVL